MPSPEGTEEPEEDRRALAECLRALQMPVAEYAPAPCQRLLSATDTLRLSPALRAGLDELRSAVGRFDFSRAELLLQDLQGQLEAGVSQGQR